LDSTFITSQPNINFRIQNIVFVWKKNKRRGIIKRKTITKVKIGIVKKKQWIKVKKVRIIKSQEKIRRRKVKIKKEERVRK